MEQVVCDTSVAVKWFVVEDYTDKALDVLEVYRHGELGLLAPDLIVPEFGNIVWKKQTMQGLPPADAAQILSEFRNVSITLIPSLSLLDDAYAISVAHGQAVYDALFVALANRVGCNLVTADVRLVNAFAPTYPNIVHVSAWALSTV